MLLTGGRQNLPSFFVSGVSFNSLPWMGPNGLQYSVVKVLPGRHMGGTTETRNKSQASKMQDTNKLQIPITNVQTGTKPSRPTAGSSTNPFSIFPSDSSVIRSPRLEKGKGEEARGDVQRITMNLAPPRWTGRTGRTTRTSRAARLDPHLSGRGSRGRGTFEAVLHELKREVKVFEDCFDGFLELLGLVFVHRGSPVGSPHAVEQTDQVTED